MSPRNLVNAPLAVLVVAASLALTAPSAFSQQGGPPPGKGGGGGHSESAVNNLSYPAALVAAVGAPADPLSATRHVLGATFSYGCEPDETIGTTTYPNTSCVAVEGGTVTYLTPEACTQCAGETIDRIYWQKVSTNYWKAKTTGPTGPTTVAYLDWGDNLESRSWTTTSTIRLETTPFEDFGTILERGYQMWHVYGQGPTEQWGVHTTNVEPPVPYVYDSPYAIIHTGNARLNIAKLSPGAPSCPTVYTPSGFTLTWTDGAGWEGACQLKDEGFTAELNVGGKYVYGYNWAIRRDRLRTCGGQTWNMAGWWRLTFYTSDDSVVFDSAEIPLSAPTLPPAAPEAVLLAEESDIGPIYIPVIDTVNNITYIDICIRSSGGGGKPQ